jgi:hypothetical protein
MKKLWSFDYVVVDDKSKERTIAFYLLALLIIGASLQSPQRLVEGLQTIFTAPGMLITDYLEIAGLGPALFNAAVVGFIGFFVIKLNKVVFNGPAIAAVFTMVGFALFGKNIWSVLPVICGVWVYSKIKKQPFKTYIFPALFGTALAPLVTQASFGFGWGIPLGIIVGMLTGLVVPPLASHALRVHEGYNIYNVGFTAGLTGMLFLSIFRNFGLNSQTVMYWGTEFNTPMRWIFIPIFVTMILLGVVFNKGKIKDYGEILKHPGTLITDFVQLGGFGNTLINMGIMGLIGCAYIELVGGHYNGPTIGGVLTIVGFAAFGKHPKNAVPIMFGVWLGTFLPFSVFKEVGASSPGPILAALFGTTLAPLAGQFGVIIGILAGIVHLSIVSQVGILHGGLNLYNNGFAGGFVAMFFVALINGYKNGNGK